MPLSLLKSRWVPLTINDSLNIDRYTQSNEPFYTAWLCKKGSLLYLATMLTRYVYATYIDVGTIRLRTMLFVVLFDQFNNHCQCDYKRRVDTRNDVYRVAIAEQ